MFVKLKEKLFNIACINSCLSHVAFETVGNYSAILYFAWEGQSKEVCCIVHKVVINYITVLYEPCSTVMCFVGDIQHCYALN